jgi:hypothetical protein
MTAVEWLYNNLKSHFEHDGDLLEVVKFSFNQAKEMEKEQLEKAIEFGYELRNNNKPINSGIDWVKEFNSLNKQD